MTNNAPSFEKLNIQFFDKRHYDLLNKSRNIRSLLIYITFSDIIKYIYE